jgi:hypothetical protein
MNKRKKYIGLTADEIFDIRLALHYLAAADKAVLKIDPEMPEIADRIGRFAALDNKLIAAEVRLEIMEGGA